MAQGSSVTLKNRTYIGLVLSQFLAAFNDQATHIVAIFYASDLLVRFVRIPGLDEKAIVSIVTASFIAPFVIFSPLAGVLADKYSKRTTLVFWKLAEVAMMALVLAGFFLPHLAEPLGVPLQTMAIVSAVIVVLGVFLMGTHAAFFAPAKYGVMPEILHPSILSRGNGLLEGTSFVAQILGTSFGGFVYAMLKSTLTLDGNLALGHEWIIGAILLGLAVVGAIFAMLIEWMPPAAPDKKLIFSPWHPMKANLGVLRRSRPLILAVFGIAFFAFMTLLLRQSLLFEGETKKDLETAVARKAQIEGRVVAAREDADDGALMAGASETQEAELRVALLISLVGLGVGIGSWCAGQCSGHKVELGLVPLGGIFIVVSAWTLAAVAHSTQGTIVTLIMIGAAAGLYIVPLYTLLQHRAPKESKGSLVATSNFLNVAGGLAAVVVFYVVTFGLQRILGLNTYTRDVLESGEQIDAYIRQLRMQLEIPRYLFVLAGVLTVVMLFFLRRRQPDFFLRMRVFLSSFRRVHVEVNDGHHFPSVGPVVILAETQTLAEAVQLTAAIDRYAEVLYVKSPSSALSPPSTLEQAALRLNVVQLPPSTAAGAQALWDAAAQRANGALARGDVVMIAIEPGCDPDAIKRLVDRFSKQPGVVVAPVHCTTSAADPIHAGQAMRFTFATALPATS